MGFRARWAGLCGRAAESAGAWGPLAPILAFPWSDARIVRLRDGRCTRMTGCAMSAPSLTLRCRRTRCRREGCASAGGPAPVGGRLP